jgi:Flp pilus assembly pilin Flp
VCSTMDATRYLPRRFLCSIESTRRSERGAALVEYALLLGLIVIVAVIAVTAFGGAVGEEYGDISDTIVDVTS